jgi:hypothetical protein
MHPIFLKTFGGLTKQYYFRQLFFGALLAALFVALSMQSPNAGGVRIGLFVFAALSTLLYPYARFVYESIVHFIMGENVFFVNAVLMMFVKSFTMLLCWSAAIFIAPIGLAYLYYHHSKMPSANAE